MVEDTMTDKIKQVKVGDWRKSNQHGMEVEAKFRLDTAGSEHIETLIIQLGEDDTDRNSDDCELCVIEPFD
ncbi:hypothetical protein MRX96_008543 [Rhipicephalus microplus]